MMKSSLLIYYFYLFSFLTVITHNQPLLNVKADDGSDDDNKNDDSDDSEDTELDDFQLPPPPTTPSKFLLRRLLSSFIHESSDYLVRVCHTKEQDPQHIGKFTYSANLNNELQFDFSTKDQDDYNLLRHNGAIYSLGLSYERSPDESSVEILEAMKRAVSYLKTEGIGPVPKPSTITQITNTNNNHNHLAEDYFYDVETYGGNADLYYEQIPKPRYYPDLLAAWEYNDTTDSKNSGLQVAKLGGAGLALIALVSLEKAEPGSTSIEYMRQIGEFILFMQKPDGSFYSKYIPQKGGYDKNFVSLYYPGESALGLLKLASIETNLTYKQKWIDIATNTLLYLEELRRYQHLDDVEPDHWALIATAELLPLLDETTSNYWRIYQHGVKVTQSLVSIVTKKSLLKHHGCHTADRRTCATSCRLEGLLAAMTFIKETELFVVDWRRKVEKLRDRVMYFIDLGIIFLLESQETASANNMHGGVPYKYPPKMDGSSSGESDDEVRVDFVQHSISAVIAYEKLLFIDDNEINNDQEESNDNNISGCGGGGNDNEMIGVRVQ